MSRGVNKVILIGSLGTDPEMRHTAAGEAVATLWLATSEIWKDRASGAPRERTEWHRVVLWRRLAEIAAEYLGKGARVYIEGKLETRKWQAHDGSEHTTTEIIARELQMLDDTREAHPGRPAAPQGAREAGAQVFQTFHAPPAEAAPLDFDDDIPF